EMMSPQKDKFPKFWRSVEVNYGRSITWFEWLVNDNGGAMTANKITQISKLEEHEIKTEIAKLYRKFTDQLMQSMTSLGAP
ncbi:MAG: hypothetical protein CMA67_03955, partial [Euryarchaeota archaeon]|nr:hypothetical protein [Euryarchaeota archaeon]